MYTRFTIYLFLFLIPSLYAQDKKASYISKATNFKITAPLSEMPILPPVPKEHKYKVIPNKLRRNKNINQNAKPYGPDPVWQDNHGSLHGRSPLIDWEGINYNEAGAIPPDPSGAVGPDHYVHMVNTSWKIFDKSDSLLYGPASLGSIWGGNVNDGDPIVMYDKFADRWFLSEFEVLTNSLMVAVSTGSDPLGTYYTYVFPMGIHFPDYPKYSVWSDGYYVTANKSGEQCYVLERDAMLLGDSLAQIIGFELEEMTTSGFFSALPAHASSTLPEDGIPNYLFYFQDDGWSNQVDTDQVKVWEIDVDWNIPTNSTVSPPLVLDVEAFDSEFTSNWLDIPQPNGQKLDAVPNALMYMAHFRSFPNYDVVVLNHTVDVDATNYAGIRWYELRKYGEEDWTIYQQGTYAPDSLNRWMGSMAMDYQGNIVLAYSVSDEATYPSLRYTGRYAGDPLGQMTIMEETIINGTSSQFGSKRFGDYSQMTIDPDDDATFWYTGEYISSGWKTRIAAIKIANDFDYDLAVVDLVDPVSSQLDTMEEISISITNMGLFTVDSFEVAYQVDNGSIITEVYTDSLIAGQTDTYTFTQTADLSIEGHLYLIKTFTGLIDDEFLMNDTILSAVLHLNANDLAVTNIVSPYSGNGLTDQELVKVHIKNLGYQSQSNFPIHYMLDGGVSVTDTVTAVLNSGGIMVYTFDETVDLSDLDTFDITVYSNLISDVNHSNDTLFKSVVNFMCMPISNCIYGDYLQHIILGTIDNTSSCSGNGFDDFTHLTTDIQQMGYDNLQVQAAAGFQKLSMWVDFNDNFSFDVNELLIDNVSYSNNNGLTSMPFNIPLSAPLGEHICRIRTRYSENIIDACESFEFGETEDYTINVVTNDTIGLDENSLDFTFEVLNVGNGKIQLNILDYKEDQLIIKIHNSIGQKVYANEWNDVIGDFEEVIDLSKFSDGYYLISIGDKKQSRVKKIVVQ